MGTQNSKRLFNNQSKGSSLVSLAGLDTGSTRPAKRKRLVYRSKCLENCAVLCPTMLCMLNSCLSFIIFKNHPSSGLILGAGGGIRRETKKTLERNYLVSASCGYSIKVHA